MAAIILLLAHSAQAAPFTILAPSGLNLRSGPGPQHPKVLTLPFGTVVEAILTPAERNYLSLTFPPGGEVIEGQRGRWIKARHKGQEGYLFSGFGLLGDKWNPQPDLHGQVALIAPYACYQLQFKDMLQRKWYAVMCGEQSIRLQPTRLNILTTNAADSANFRYADVADTLDHRVEIVPDCGEGWSCLIGVREPLDLNLLDTRLRVGLAREELGRFLDIGQEYQWQQGGRSLRIRALLKPLSGREDLGDYYHLELAYQGTGPSTKHLLCEEVLATTDVENLRGEGVPRILFIGDLNGDAWPDVLIEGSGEMGSCGQYNHAKLFMTQVKGDRVHLQSVAETHTNYEFGH